MNTWMYGLGRFVNYLITVLGVILGVVVLGILVVLAVSAYRAIFC